MAAGVAGAKAIPEPLWWFCEHPNAWAARGADGAGRCRGLDCGTDHGEVAGRQAAVECLAGARHRRRAERIFGNAQSSTTHTGIFRRACRAPGFSETFLADGKAPCVGTQLKQEAFAETLAHLARKGLDDFYRGDIGDAIATDLERIGSPVTREDLQQNAATLATALCIETEAGTLFNTGAPTQGVAALLILALFSRFNVSEAEGFDHIHGLVEATKRALYLSGVSVTDPKHLVYALDRYLQPNFITGEADAIDRTRAATWPLLAGDKGDTVWMGAADASGIVVSYLQSIFWEFGSGCVLPATGILMQNRGVSFRSKRIRAIVFRRDDYHSTRSVQRSQSSGMDVSWHMAPSAGLVSRKRKVPFSRVTRSLMSRLRRQSHGRGGCCADSGAKRSLLCGLNHASIKSSSTNLFRRATTSKCWKSHTPTSWVMQERWWCIPTKIVRAP